MFEYKVCFLMYLIMSEANHCEHSTLLDILWRISVEEISSLSVSCKKISPDLFSREAFLVSKFLFEEMLFGSRSFTNLGTY